MARPQRGFSLVEVLVALSLTSLLLASLYSALAASGRTVTSTSKAQRITNDQRLISTALRAVIANAVPMTERRADRPLVLFDGHRSSLRLVSHLPAHAGGGGLQFVEIGAKDMLLGQRSLMLWFRNAWPSVAFETPTHELGWESEALLLKVERLEFEYFGSDDDRGAPNWRDSWRSSERLPTLIRVAVTADEAWPDLVVPLHTEVSEAMPYWHRDIWQVE
jgi:general secretion pathway protein J